MSISREWRGPNGNGFQCDLCPATDIAGFVEVLPPDRSRGGSDLKRLTRYLVCHEHYRTVGQPVYPTCSDPNHLTKEDLRNEVEAILLDIISKPFVNAADREYVASVFARYGADKRVFAVANDE